MNRFCVIGSILLTLFASVASADVPQLINYQGKLTKAGGKPVDGVVALGFGFFDAPTGGYKIYYEEHAGVKVEEGIFSILIGNGSNQFGPFEDVPLETNLYLETTINPGRADAETLAPRHRIASTVYALRAGYVDGLDLANILSRLAELEEKLARVSVSEDGNDIYVTGANMHIRNGEGSTETASSVGNLIIGYNEFEGPGRPSRWGSHNIVIGGHHSYTGYAGFVAGKHNTISAPYASVTGGFNNVAGGSYSSVSGGYYNTAMGGYASVSGGNGNDATDFYACVSGGRSNTASGVGSSVSGGSSNTASGESSSVSGGNGNTASGTWSSVSGGSYNTASGGCSFVAGGGILYSQTDGNVAFGLCSAILGGSRNVAGDPNLIDHLIGKGSTISGGVVNTASGLYSTVSGGQNNTASGYCTTVSGGANLVASGNNEHVP